MADKKDVNVLSIRGMSNINTRHEQILWLEQGSGPYQHGCKERNRHGPYG